MPYFVFLKKLYFSRHKMLCFFVFYVVESRVNNKIFMAEWIDSTAYAVGYYPTGDFGLLYVQKKSSDFL